jgi:hypothetical protein
MRIQHAIYLERVVETCRRSCRPFSLGMLIRPVVDSPRSWWARGRRWWSPTACLRKGAASGWVGDAAFVSPFLMLQWDGLLNGWPRSMCLPPSVPRTKQVWPYTINRIRMPPGGLSVKFQQSIDTVHASCGPPCSQGCRSGAAFPSCQRMGTFSQHAVISRLPGWWTTV